jgi:hypothetical protein
VEVHADRGSVAYPDGRRGGDSILIESVTVATTETPDALPDRIYLDDLSQMLDPKRAVHTIRQWVSQELLPPELMPGREGGRQALYWRPDQVAGLNAFARERESRRGWAAQHRASEENS